MTTRQVLDRFGFDLSAEERRRFAEALDRECERLGALLAQASPEGGSCASRRRRPTSS
jgi:hypothetical protein